MEDHNGKEIDLEKFTIKELKEKMSNRLGTAISLGGYHSRTACKDVVDLIEELFRRASNGR